MAGDGSLGDELVIGLRGSHLTHAEHMRQRSDRRQALTRRQRPLSDRLPDCYGYLAIQRNWPAFLQRYILVVHP